jgi:MFS family permease
MPVFTPKLLVIILVMIIGSMMTTIHVGWGYIEVSISSYLYSFSDSITTGKVHMLFSIIKIGQIIAAQTFNLLTSRLGYRETLTLALVLNVIGWVICSISTKIWGFTIPALLWGISIVLQYLAFSLFLV